MDEEESGDANDGLMEYFDGVLAIEDDGRTLVLQTKPKDEDPLGLSALTLDCVVTELGMPTWVEKSISTTRALDGRQSADWDEYSAQWGYHPDNGLNLIVIAR